MLAGNSASKYTLRPYQQEAVNAARKYLLDKNAKKPVLLVLPTGSGKSLCIASIAEAIDAPLIVFQPTKEILEQNYHKMMDYGIMGVTIYSASMNRKEIGNITLATIGSVYKKPEDFKHFKYIIIDECHLANSQGGMYKTFVSAVGEKLIGLTATPYRLAHNSFGSILRFLTRTNPRIFSKVIHVTQTRDLSRQGYFCKTEYYQIKGFNRSEIQINSTGADYVESSEKEYYTKHEFNKQVLDVVRRLLKVGKTRILVFTKFVDEARTLAEELGDVAAMVNGEMKAKERDRIIKGFRSGEIKVVANVGVLTCLSEDTEILTRNKGWVGISNIEPTDLVAQYKNGAISFINPLHIHRDYNFAENMVEIDGRYTSFKVTHNHQILHRPKWSDTYTKSNAIDIVDKKIVIPVSGFAKEDSLFVSQEKRCSDSRFIITNSYNYRKRGASWDTSKSLAKELLNRRNSRRYKSPHELTIDECRLIGFWLGDGSKSSPTSGGAVYSLTQSLRHDNMLGWIETILSNCNVDYSFTDYNKEGKTMDIMGNRCHVYGHRTYRLCIGTGGNKQTRNGIYSIIPYLHKKGTDLFWGFNREQYFALMEGLFKADGWHGNNIGYYGQKIIGEYKELFDLLQAIGVCRGFRVTVRPCKMRKNNKKQLYNISLYDKQSHQLVNERAKLVRNKKPLIVWCVTMPQGTIITRRNGCVTIMGNCGFDYPELEVVVLARPTRSLNLYYQMMGRCVRPHPSKEAAWIVDMCGNYEVFGRMEDMMLVEYNDNLWYVESRGRKLTNVYLNEVMKD